MSATVPSPPLPSPRLTIILAAVALAVVVVGSDSASAVNGDVHGSTYDAWAVGNGGIVAHWDGTKGRQVLTPATGTLLPVAMTSANDGWAVGWGGLWRWDGGEWSSHGTLDANQALQSAIRQGA